MTAIDRDYALRVVNQAHGVQEKRAEVYTKQAVPSLVLTAETRSYTVSLLIDAIEAGLLEQLHDEAEQQLYIDVALDQDDAWAAYLAGMGAAPQDTAPVAVPVGDNADNGVDHFDATSARRVFHATDGRVEQLAEAFWRLNTGQTADAWRTRGDRSDLQMDARGWLRAAVAAGLLPPPPEPLPLPVVDEHLADNAPSGGVL